MIVSLIVAVAQNYVIGKDNNLVWHLPADMNYFKKTTLGHHIVCGRKNYLSIPKKFRPLVDRTNIVLTRNNDFYEEGIVVLNDIESAIDYAKKNNETELFVIGGGEIYKQYLNAGLIDKMYITWVKANFDGDTYFPTFDFPKWKKVSSETRLANEKNKYDLEFAVYQKV